MRKTIPFRSQRRHGGGGNSFFRAGGEWSEPPRRAYARFDHLDLPESVNGGGEGDDVSVLAFEAIDANWVESRSGKYSLDDPDWAQASFNSYWVRQFGGHPDEINPYEGARLSIIEFTAPPSQIVDEIVGFAEGPQWYLLERDGPTSMPADSFGNLFGEPQNTRYSIEAADPRMSSALDAAFDMTSWPGASPRAIKNAILPDPKSVEVEGLACFDIGQGSANALLDANGLPWLYYDLGAGITRNASTTPTPLRYCFTQKPAILLSHWDMDHWAGAARDPRALQRTWIAPRQSIGLAHAVFANDILRAGGQLLIWDSSTGPITVNTGNCEITVSQCTGSGRNDSGLALSVRNFTTKESWLLTGDAAYDKLGHKMPANPTAVVVPHHGAKLKSTLKTPLKGSGARTRLIYSFGPSNAHGRTSVQHPTSHAVTTHQAAAWDHGTWAGQPLPGGTIAGADVFATAQHPTGHLGGVQVRWSTANGPFRPPACGGQCTTKLTQYT